MIILGKTACGDSDSMMATATNIEDINMIQLSGGVFDEFFVTTRVYTTWNGSIPDEWDFDTKIHALFQESLFGGNVEFTAESVSSILVKKRRIGDLHWKTFFEIPIHSNEDFNFMRNDFYNRSEEEYQYSIVPTLNGVEGRYSSNHNTSTLRSKFDGIVLVEKDVAYRAILDVRLSERRNFAVSVLEPKGRKKSIAVYNGDANYREYDVEGTFIPFDDGSGDFDLEHSRAYREEVDDFLTNRKPKILKYADGRMAMVCIVDSPVSHSSHNHISNVSTSFTAVETGDCESVNDLYDNNFIDTDHDVDRSI